MTAATHGWPASHQESVRLTGFHYVDWQFDGDDLIYLVRTAYAGAHNFHDANRITFHRLDGFRSLLGPTCHGPSNALDAPRVKGRGSEGTRDGTADERR